MSSPELRIGVLASGGGSTFEAVQEAINNNQMGNTEISFVVCNNGPDNPSAGVWERAQRLGIPILHISNKTEDRCTLPENPDRTSVEGTISYEVSNRLLQVADHYGVHLLVGLGYMKRVIGKVLEGIPIANEHPGPLPETAGERLEHAQKKVMELGLTSSGPTFHWMDTRLDERGVPEYDSGKIIGHTHVPITGQMRLEWETHGTVELLQKEVMSVEKRDVIGWILKAGEQLNAASS